MKKSVLIVMIAGLLFTNCKKNNPEPLTRSQLLTSRKWQLSVDVFSYPGSPDYDLYAQMRPCSLDDYLQFNSPNTFIRDEGATKCAPLDSQTQLGIWALSNSDSQLIITDNASSYTYTILEVTDTSLKMSRPVPQSAGGDAIITLTYKVKQ